MTQNPSKQMGVQTALQQIRQALETIRYGSVEVVIHDSKVVQLELREKFRFDRETA